MFTPNLSSIPPLSPKNPLDHLRLLWWTFITPQQLKAYREQYGEKAERPTSKWLGSSLIWLPFLLPSLILVIQTFAEGTYPVFSMINLSIIFIAWLFTGVFGNREHYQVGGVGVIFGVALGILLGIALGISLGVGLAVSLLLGLILGLVGGVAAGMGIVLVAGLSIGLAIGLTVGQPLAIKLGMAVQMGRPEKIIFGLSLMIILQIVLSVGVAFVVEKSLKTGRPSWFARGAFGLLVAVSGFFVLFSFLLGGLQMLL